MAITRKDFLTSAGSAAAGLAVGILGRRRYFLGSGTSNNAPTPPPNDEYPDITKPAESYSQCGEDVNVKFSCSYLKIDDINYLDIGAHHPTLINNTYLFYRQGGQGVLVEPNIALCEKLRAVRPRDTTLVAGIGVTTVKEADYYLMTDSSWNTFSKEEAEHQFEITNGQIKIEKVLTKVPLLNINEVMEEHFKAARRRFVSVDAEGLHLAILKSIDYTKYRPKIICAETLVSGSLETISEIPDFMKTKGYAGLGGSFVNTIFIDSNLI